MSIALYWLISRNFNNIHNYKLQVNMLHIGTHTLLWSLGCSKWERRIAPKSNNFETVLLSTNRNTFEKNDTDRINFEKVSLTGLQPKILFSNFFSEKSSKGIISNKSIHCIINNFLLIDQHQNNCDLMYEILLAFSRHF